MSVEEHCVIYGVSPIPEEERAEPSNCVFVLEDLNDSAISKKCKWNGGLVEYNSKEEVNL